MLLARPANRHADRPNDMADGQTRLNYARAAAILGFVTLPWQPDTSCVEMHSEALIMRQLRG